MNPTLAALLLLHQASQATQAAHAKLLEIGLTAAAEHCRRAGDAIAMSVGLLVKSEADKRRAELAANGGLA